MKLRVLSLALALGTGCTTTVGAKPRYLPGSTLSSFDEVVARASQLGDAALLADVRSLSERPEPQQSSPALEQLVSCAWSRVEAAPRVRERGQFEQGWRKRSEQCLDRCAQAATASLGPDDRALVGRLRAGCDSELRAATDALHALFLGPAEDDLRKLEANTTLPVAQVLNALGAVRSSLTQATGESTQKTAIQDRLKLAEAKYASVVEADRRLSEDPRFQELLQRGSELDRRISSLMVQSRGGDRVPRSPEAAYLVEQLRAERAGVSAELIALQRKYRGD